MDFCAWKQAPGQAGAPSCRSLSHQRNASTRPKLEPRFWAPLVLLHVSTAPGIEMGSATSGCDIAGVGGATPAAKLGSKIKPAVGGRHDGWGARWKVSGIVGEISTQLPLFAFATNTLFRAPWRVNAARVPLECRALLFLDQGIAEPSGARGAEGTRRSFAAAWGRRSIGLKTRVAMRWQGALTAGRAARACTAKSTPPQAVTRLPLTLPLSIFAGGVELMCQAQAQGRHISHDKLEQMRGATGYLMKSAGGTVKSTEDKQMQTERPAVQRMIMPAVVAIFSCLFLNQLGLFVPIVMMTRNCIM